MTLAEELQWRGLVKDRTFDDLKWLNTPRTFYLGVDCSADSMTIGNLATCMLAKRLIKGGWKVVLLTGGATSLIGDPGGKDEERPLKSRQEITRNVKGIKRQFKQLFEGYKFEVVDNYDWFKGVGYLDFLRDVGKHYSMTELIQRDFIVTRLGEGSGGISYAEFSYSLIQGYDYWHLYKTKGVVLQIGGSDQWGNMLSGVPLIRKKENQEVHAMSMPLVINKATGKKFGKSEGGAVWLDPARTSPTQFYQFWINADDEGVEDYLKVYTELDKAAVEEIMARHGQNPGARYAQTTLAEAVTALVHGRQQTAIAKAVTEYLTGKETIGSADKTVLNEMRKEIPAIRAKDSGSIIDALAESGLAESKTEARRLLAGNAISLNGRKVTREAFEPGDFENGRLLLRRGKAFKDSALVEQQK